MTFLPVVERELRVAARRRETYRLRTLAALLPVLVGGAILLLALLPASVFAPATLGRTLFGLLGWLAAAAVVFSGLFLTADCLSQEKRDGTLGLLFLTSLGGHDVVLGKLISTSLHAFLALLGTFPVLGLTLLLGGVTGAEFARACLALLNALFLSLVVGLFVSARSRQPHKAMAGTLGLLVLIALLGEFLRTRMPTVLTQGMACGLNPLRVFANYDFSPRFWPGLITGQILAWFILALACVQLPRHWREAIDVHRAHPSPDSASSRRRGPRRPRNRALLDRHPMQWLAAYERWPLYTLWSAAGLAIAAFLLIPILAQNQVIFAAQALVTGPLYFVVSLLVADQACRFPIETRRSGLLDLVLVTPLSTAEMIRGQSRIWLSRLGWPLGILIATQMTGTYLQQKAMLGLSRMAFSTTQTASPPFATPSTSGTATNSTPTTANGRFTKGVVGSRSVTITTTTVGVPFSISTPVNSPPSRAEILATRWSPVLAAAMTALNTTANLAALVWFGMWTGLRARTPPLATLKTYACVQALPWVFIWIASAGLIPLAMRLVSEYALDSTFVSGFWFTTLFAGFHTALTLVKDAAFILWSRRRILTRFRALIGPTTEALPHVPPILPAPNPSYP